MENNGKKTKETRSMYLYTALIFVVALLLILLAFFGQTNISKLGNRANEITQSTPAALSTDSPPTTEEFAQISNMAVSLDKENKDLKDKLQVYDNLINANDLASQEKFSDAQAIIDTIAEENLSDGQKVLYEQIKDKIAEGEEK